MSTIITDLTNHIKVEFTSTTVSRFARVPKAGLRVDNNNTTVFLTPEALSKEKREHPNVIRIPYADATPLESSAEDLADVIMGYLDDFYAATGGGGGGAAGGGNNTYSTEQGDFTATPTNATNLIVLSVDSIGGVAIAENHFANAILKVHNDDTDEMITFALNDFTWDSGTKTLDVTNDTYAFTFANFGGDVDVVSLTLVGPDKVTGDVSGEDGVLVGSDLGAYTFDASAQQVTITGIRDLLLEEIITIVNVTDNIVIYNANDSSRGGSIASNVIDVDFDTTAMADADDLAVKIHYNNSEDYVLGGKKVYLQNAIPPNYDAPSGDLLAGTPFELDATPTDMGAEIPMNGRNRLVIWVTVDIGTSTAVTIRALFKHTSGGAEEYRQVYYGAPAANLVTVNLMDYRIAANADQLVPIIIDTDGIVSYIQLQASDAADGDGQIDAVYITKAWI